MFRRFQVSDTLASGTSVASALFSLTSSCRPEIRSRDIETRRTVAKLLRAFVYAAEDIHHAPTKLGGRGLRMSIQPCRHHPLWLTSLYRLGYVKSSLALRFTKPSERHRLWDALPPRHVSSGPSSPQPLLLEHGRDWISRITRVSTCVFGN